VIFPLYRRPSEIKKQAGGLTIGLARHYMSNSKNRILDEEMDGFTGLFRGSSIPGKNSETAAPEELGGIRETCRLGSRKALIETGTVCLSTSFGRIKSEESDTPSILKKGLGLWIGER